LGVPNARRPPPSLIIRSPIPSRVRHKAPALPFRPPCPFKLNERTSEIEISKHERRRHPRVSARPKGPPDSLARRGESATPPTSRSWGVGGAFLPRRPSTLRRHPTSSFSSTSPVGEVRARGVVRHGSPRSRHGACSFVHMGAEDRARLHRFRPRKLAQDHSLESGSRSPPAGSSAARSRSTPGEIKNAFTSLFALLNKIYSARPHRPASSSVLGRVRAPALFSTAGQLVFATSSDRQDSLGENDVARRAPSPKANLKEAAEAGEDRPALRFRHRQKMGIFTVDQGRRLGPAPANPNHIFGSRLPPPAAFIFFSSLEKKKTSVPEISIPVPLGQNSWPRSCAPRQRFFPSSISPPDADLQIDLSPDPAASLPGRGTRPYRAPPPRIHFASGLRPIFSLAKLYGAQGFRRPPRSMLCSFLGAVISVKAPTCAAHSRAGSRSSLPGMRRWPAADTCRGTTFAHRRRT